MTGWPGQELHPDAYRALVEGAPAILYIDRPDELSTNLYTSPQIVELLGYTVEEWMRDAELWVRSLHPDDRERVVREHRTSNANGERFMTEYRILAKDGREVWIRDEAVPVDAEDGTVLYWRGVMVDITPQKRAEDQLRASLEDVQRMVAQRRDLAQLLETAQEEERRRIAADIHDDPIQVMSAVDMRLQLLLERPERVDSHVLGELAEELRSAIDRLRNLLFELRPVALDLEGLTPAIGMYLEHAAKETGWTWEVIDELDDEPAAEARVAFYRIAQEAVANVRKHANATHVEVRLSSEDGGLLLRIEDDGDGFDPSETPLPGHLGLATITERAELAGGWCRIQSRSSEGSILECWMPLGTPVEAP
ncbi:MAG TPA: PAS domain-containing protein [Actinomycetota bacterium]|nr:PAS domain-containing protein [Actinomycetota bacterium]